MNVLIIIASFLLAIFVSFIILKKTHSTTKSLGAALLVHICVLGTAIYMLYMRNEEVQIFGMVSTNFQLLLWAIPVVTWLNGAILQLKRKYEV